MINDLMIKSFLALTDTLNFTNAAKRLYLSQQAVSKHIAKLEDELECQLFFRSRGDISLTPAGKIYFNVFSQYIDNMANATILVRNMTGAAKHKLIIGHLEMLDIRLTLSSVVKKLKQRYPDIELEMDGLDDSHISDSTYIVANVKMTNNTQDTVYMGKTGVAQWILEAGLNSNGVDAYIFSSLNPDYSRTFQAGDSEEIKLVYTIWSDYMTKEELEKSPLKVVYSYYPGKNYIYYEGKN